MAVPPIVESANRTIEIRCILCIISPFQNPAAYSRSKARRILAQDYLRFALGDSGNHLDIIHGLHDGHGLRKVGAANDPITPTRSINMR